MNSPVHLFSRIWVVIPAGALAFLIWSTQARMQRVEYVSNLPGRAEPVDILDAKSPTGYAHGQRELIVPERNEDSFHWIAQTQQMFAARQWRVRHVDYDNAPQGRKVTSASPYRWWLGLVAWFDHDVSGRPLGLSVERAALWADPLLHGLVLVGATALVAWQFGAVAASFLAVGLVAIFPFGAGFLPGAPDDHGLANACALGSILLLLAGMKALSPPAGEGDAASADRKARRWFAVAGIAGGLGVWVRVPVAVPILIGIFLGGLLAAWAGRPRGAGDSPAMSRVPPWRLWAGCGAGTILVGYLAEFFPADLGAWQLKVIHPLYGLAWIGAGELLTHAVAWIQCRRKPFASARDWIGLLLAVAAIATVPVALKLSGSRGFLAVELSSFRLTAQPRGVDANNLWTWLVRDGISATVWATFLPLALVLPALWLILRRATDSAARAPLALALGPVAVTAAFACWRLQWWHLLDGTLLALAAVALPVHLAIHPRAARWLWTALAALLVIPGVSQLWPQRITRASDPLTPAEAEELIERHLAHWLARRSVGEPVVVFAPPHQTASLCFYGGLAGLGTLGDDNDEGLRATITIASVTTLPEAQLLIQSRKIRYLVIPSWDPFFDEYARLFLVKSQSGRKSVFIPELRRLNLPPWLRPIPYQILKIAGYEDQSALVIEVVDEQSPALAMSRLAEYLVETGDLERATSVGQELRRFPGDIGALAARAQIESVRNDAAGFGQSVELLLERLAGGADRYLPWDRRVSLAIVLARADRVVPAREQVHRCLLELDGKKARSLTAGSLFNLLVLSRAFDDPVVDPKLRALVLELLPVDLRDRL